MNAVGKKKYSPLSCVLLIYALSGILLITLLPFNFHFDIPHRIRLVWHGDLLDVLSNILLFMPVGFLYRLSFRKDRRSLCLQELIFGIIFSLIIEVLQFFLPSRTPTVSDVLTNGFGIWLGAQFYIAVISRLDRDRLIRQFSLELPLMALLFFLTPLLWINAYTTGIYPARLVLLLLLGLFGVGILSSVYIHRLQFTGTLSVRGMLLVTAVWFFGASVPGLINAPGYVILVGLVPLITAAIQIHWPRRSWDRRFEIFTLKRFLPLYAAYILLLMLWPPRPELISWEATLWLNSYFYKKPLFIKFRFMEYAAAFTLLGYIVSALGARNQDTPKKSVCRLCLGLVICTSAVTVLRGFHPLYSASLVEWGWITASALSGGIIYRLRLAAVREFCNGTHLQDTKDGELFKSLCE